MLIGLGHTARVGKDTCGAILSETHGFQTIAFADALRDMVYRTQPTVRAIVDRIGWDEGKEAYPDIVRKALIEVGNVAREVIDTEVWINAAFNRATADRVCITDVRYPTECDAIKARGGLLVRVTRPGYEPLDNVADHALVGYDGWDATISNDGTLEDLTHAVNEVVGVFAWHDLEMHDLETA